LREEEELGKEAKREYKKQKKAEATAVAQEVHRRVKQNSKTSSSVVILVKSTSCNKPVPLLVYCSSNLSRKEYQSQ
jgi:two-component sensor histidine kinase